MEVRKLIQKDRSAVSTIAVIAIVIILVIAAGAAYMILSGNDKEEVAPGTMMKYEVYYNDVLSETQEQTVVGQNADSYLFSVKIFTTTQSYKLYSLEAKSSPSDMEMTGTESMETMDGLKTLEVWKYTKNGYQVKSYIDALTGLSYKDVAIVGTIEEKHILIDYEIVTQTSYKQSKSIGKTYEYAIEVAPGISYKAELKCVADCLDNQFGVMYDFSSINLGEVYFLSANIQGLPTDAINTGATTTLSTIDGDVTVQVWGLTIAEGFSMTFFYDAETKLVYKFVVSITTLGDLPFELTKKPK